MSGFGSKSVRQTTFFADSASVLFENTKGTIWNKSVLRGALLGAQANR